MFAVDPEATLDVYVAGTVLATAELSVGSPGHPARSRVYVGGRCATAGSACRLDADCCSASCAAGGCQGDGAPTSVRISSTGRLNGGFHASEGAFIASSGLDLYGSLLVGSFHSGSRLAIHHDRALLANGQECPR